jgi:hypothetical protein
MITNIDHVLLTRFNLPTPGVESLVRAQEGWLRKRVDLFETYCVPSVLSQTNRQFHWIIYFDPESPEWLREKIAAFEAQRVFSPIFRESVPPVQLIQDLRTVTGARGATLLTTNLDNDDGLAVDFVERLQQCTSSAPRAAVYLNRGLILSPMDLHLREDRHNAFCSVREGWDDPSTCWSDWHDLLPRHMPVTEIGGEPAWLQVVHGTNVSNRVKGRLVRQGSYPALFPGLLGSIDDPDRRELVVARLVVEPLRGLRDAARVSAKRAARAILGKDGFDRLKTRIAGLRARGTSTERPAR